MQLKQQSGNIFSNSMKNPTQLPTKKSFLKVALPQNTGNLILINPDYKNRPSLQPPDGDSAQEWIIIKTPFSEKAFSVGFGLLQELIKLAKTWKSFFKYSFLKLLKFETLGDWVSATSSQLCFN